MFIDAVDDNGQIVKVAVTNIAAVSPTFTANACYVSLCGGYGYIVNKPFDAVVAEIEIKYKRLIGQA